MAGPAILLPKSSRHSARVEGKVTNDSAHTKGDEMIAHLDIHTDFPPDGWDETVRQLGGSIFHSSLWALYQQKTYGAQPIFLLARDTHAEECGGAVAFFHRSRHPIAS